MEDFDEEQELQQALAHVRKQPWPLGISTLMSAYAYVYLIHIYIYYMYLGFTIILGSVFFRHWPHNSGNGPPPPDAAGGGPPGAKGMVKVVTPGQTPIKSPDTKRLKPTEVTVVVAPEVVPEQHQRLESLDTLVLGDEIEHPGSPLEPRRLDGEFDAVNKSNMSGMANENDVPGFLYIFVCCNCLICS